MLCEIQIWTHCSSCQITLQKFLWFTKYSSLLRKQSYTEVLIWTKMSSHIPCLLPYLLHLLREIVLKMATLLKLQAFFWFFWIELPMCRRSYTNVSEYLHKNHRIPCFGRHPKRSSSPTIINPGWKSKNWRGILYFPQL